MRITPDMKVSDVLSQHPELLEIFVSQSPEFARLRNPIMRKTFARLVTVAQAANMGKVALDDLLMALNRALGEDYTPDRTIESHDVVERPRPGWVDTAPVAITLDVRDDQRRQEEPYKKIMAASVKVRPGQIFLLRNTFEPLPLYEVLGKRGFENWARQLGEDDWEIYFFRPNLEPQDQTPDRRLLAPDSRTRTPELETGPFLDNRGLEPPEPMIRTLEAAERLGENEVLTIHNDQRPMFLYQRLEERGFAHQTEEQSDGSAIVRIWRQKTENR